MEAVLSSVQYCMGGWCTALSRWVDLESLARSSDVLLVGCGLVDVDVDADVNQ